ncbi:MAG: sugar kinase [Saezia sp.]
MSAALDRKVVLVTRQTRLEDLIQRYHTLAQAKFYIEHLGADFSDYLRESEAYTSSLRQVVETLQTWGRYQIIERRFLPNYVFGERDIVVALGQDGLVANTMKYLHGHPVIGINPEPTRWDGVLLPFAAKDLQKILPLVATQKRQAKAITIAQATLSNGQTLRAVNDFFIGPKGHTSALYEIEVGAQREMQSSSGLIVSTGLGSTAWLKSIVTGSMAISQAFGFEKAVKVTKQGGKETAYQPMPWDTQELRFAVREPFPSRASETNLVFGSVDVQNPLKLRSRMAENGIIFSDGIAQDFMEFNAGMEATITLAPEQGRLVV